MTKEAKSALKEMYISYCQRKAAGENRMEACTFRVKEDERLSHDFEDALDELTEMGYTMQMIVNGVMTDFKDVTVQWSLTYKGIGYAEKAYQSQK